ncbi:NAD(P)-binding protein [Aulographum hederae CBS 113979]|uniref:NAD(P)-binding protein n=1 Tax=Aulographum hederae CBS 113979 TaxID=1176131 RepID=A0A6G1H5J6_9PEZI|nr:NAD(P)-binding protein [Aulographum hederae CBS 113979]
MSSSSEPPKSLSGKVAIVTGGSRGIGAGIALDLAKRGAKIMITYTSASSAPAVENLIYQITSLGSSASSIALDLRDPSAPSQIAAATMHQFGRIDILINNAGTELTKPISSVTLSDYASVMDLNVRAAYLMIQSVLPHLPSSGGGRVINISSVGARCGFANFSVYCASKGALEGLTRSLAAELGPAGHTVNAVEPGPVESDMMDNLPRELIELQKKMTPVGNRFGRVGDVAEVVGWIAEEGSRWVSGQCISASGGYLMT